MAGSNLVISNATGGSCKSGATSKTLLGCCVAVAALRWLPGTVN